MKTEALQREGRLQMMGIIQEQHPDRCRLFMQWKQMDWPVMVDKLNLLNVSVVPITLLVRPAQGTIRCAPLIFLQRNLRRAHPSPKRRPVGGADLPLTVFLDKYLRDARQV